MTHHIGDNQGENEKLFKCAECGRVLDSGESCCAPAPFDDRLEAMTTDEYREHCRKVRHENA